MKRKLIKLALMPLVLVCKLIKYGGHLHPLFCEWKIYKED